MLYIKFHENLTTNKKVMKVWKLYSKSISNNFSNSLIPPLILPDNSIATSPIQKCLAFSNLFRNNSTLDDSNAPPPPNPPPSRPMPSPIFSTRRVYCVLSKLDVTKAYGSDGIPPRVLRECASELSPVFSRLFRLIFKTKSFPKSWKHSLVQPIPKSGDRSNPSNFPPNLHSIFHLESVWNNFK